MKSRLLVFVVVLGLGAIAVGWVYESQLREDDDRADLVIPDNIDYFLTGLRYRVMNDQGRINYEFTSPRLEHRPLTDVSHIESPSLQIFRGRANWRLDSELGEFEHADNRLRLINDVVALRGGETPLRLESDSLQFEPDLDRVISDSQLVMTTPDSRVQAESAVFDLANDVYRLQKTRAVYRHGAS